MPEFDLTAAVVFTNDNCPDGLLAAWQKKTREIGRSAAGWAIDLAEEEYHKVVKTHARLEEMAPPLEDPKRLTDPGGRGAI